MPAHAFTVSPLRALPDGHCALPGTILIRIPLLGCRLHLRAGASAYLTGLAVAVTHAQNRACRLQDNSAERWGYRRDAQRRHEQPAAIHHSSCPALAGAALQVHAQLQKYTLTSQQTRIQLSPIYCSAGVAFPSNKWVVIELQKEIHACPSIEEAHFSNRFDGTTFWT